MNEALQYRLDILKKELDVIDSSIRKIDDIGNSIKNFAIVVWSGSIAILLADRSLHDLLYISGITPLLFLFVDAHWRRNQRRFIYRQGQIRDFLNSSRLDKAFETGSMDFVVLDPMARDAHKQPSFRKFISMWRVLGFPTVAILYVGLAVLSISLAVLVNCQNKRSTEHSTRPGSSPAVSLPSDQP